jgi:hypothetical protein
MSKEAYQHPQGTNLTQSEMEGILKGKPNMEALLSVYDQYSQDEMDMDISKAQPVW